MSAPEPMGYRVGQIAELAGITIRTLHHYEQIGLLVPSHRTMAGYRLYTDADIDRLTRVLYYRELGFPLDAIASLLDSQGLSTLEHLESQHQQLLARLERLRAMVTGVEREMEAALTGYNLTAEEKLDVFGSFDPAEYDDEAEERWGNTDAWNQSRRRTASYTKDQWIELRAEMDGNTRRFAEAFSAGASATSVTTMNLAEEHRALITKWFYDCSAEMHRGLGDLYVSDPRFTENIDQSVVGLAAYLREAFIANADRIDE